MQVSEVFPHRVPDLYVGRPVILTGRFQGTGPATVRITGRAGGQTRQFNVSLNPDEVAASESARALPAVWARTKIADLADQATFDRNIEVDQEVKQVALEYGLMSSFTSFVAVDSLNRTAGSVGTTIGVPLPLPEGEKYETIDGGGPR